MPLDTLRTQLRAIAAVRQWQPLHSPKNLALALSVEAAELPEHFQWLTEAHSRHLQPQQLTAVWHELADVLLYVLLYVVLHAVLHAVQDVVLHAVQVADSLGVDLMQAAQDKLAHNALKYPIDPALAA